MDPGPHRNDSPPPSPSRRAVLCGGVLVSLAAAGTTARAGAPAGTAPSSRAGIAPSPQSAEGAQAMSVFGFNTG
jgi:hypothetical protein